MAASVESTTPDKLNKESTSCAIQSPIFSPSSDKRFWSALSTRIDTILENRKPFDPSFPSRSNSGESEGAKRMREDSMLLLKGFDSVAHSLSRLSKTLDNALQGARDLARPPTMTEIYQNAMEKAKSKEVEETEEAKEEEEEEGDEGKRGLKRKFDVQNSCEEHESDPQKEMEKIPKEEGKLKKAKNVGSSLLCPLLMRSEDLIVLAISMATKATSLARELKSIQSDFCFMQERCALLEEENRRLRDGFAKGIRPEEDDLVINHLPYLT
ncbi:hypothetical protein U1Q18_034127 [Sarracenia purpurea var. burkii]